MKQKQNTQPFQPSPRLEGQELLDSLTRFPTVDGPRQAIEELLAIARGSAMILHALFDSLSDKGFETIADGISQALLLACDQVEFKYLKSPGELAMTLNKKILIALLEKKVRELKQSEPLGHA
jgi:hypothetical protein